ncbi:hypothetical protein GCM10023238_38100 [Streptomyces heliomycini]
MIREVTGIRKIRMLYLQLLYRCNFTCLHCFHGKRLQYADAFTADEAVGLLTLMRDEYGTEAVTLLGGEPFVHRDLSQVVRHAKEELGQRVEICTNGYRIERRLTEIAPHLDLLRSPGGRRIDQRRHPQARQLPERPRLTAPGTGPRSTDRCDHDRHLTEHR